MKHKFTLSAFGLLLGFTANAQNTLNIHQKDGTVVRYAFSEKPVVTYTDIGIHLVSKIEEIDYPMENLQMWTFEDNPSQPTGIFQTEGTKDDIRIYTTAGILVRTIPQNAGNAIFSTADLPAGVYIINNGKTSYKITKR